jgi:Icc-related predicted phosphoesterase
MKILVIADIYGEFEKLEKILDKVRGQDFDLVVSPGNMTDSFKQHTDFSQMDIADIILQKLISLKKPVYCVPGNHDPYEILDIFTDYGINLHYSINKNHGIQFMGFGGARTPFNTLFEPTEEETKDALNKMHKKIKGKFILVTHNPPKDTKIDKISSGEHVGSQTIKDFIIKSKPLLLITAHIHEAAGVDSIGPTTIFNPGPAFNNSYGIVNITGDKIVCKSYKA